MMDVLRYYIVSYSTVLCDGIATVLRIQYCDFSYWIARLGFKNALVGLARVLASGKWSPEVK